MNNHFNTITPPRPKRNHPIELEFHQKQVRHKIPSETNSIPDSEDGKSEFELQIGTDRYKVLNPNNNPSNEDEELGDPDLDEGGPTLR